MAKIILTNGRIVLRSMPLTKERITIGRRPHNDIVIDDLAISGEHAVIVTANGDSFLEDLNSTNGTQINGQPIKKHFLQDGDVVELAQYRISYVVKATLSSDAGAEELEEASSSLHDDQRPLAFIRVMNGANAGRISFLKRPLTTIGRPGDQVAVIAWKDGHYHLAHVEGDAYPLVNGQPIDPAGHLISSGDSIDLSGTTIQFSLLTDR